MIEERDVVMEETVGRREKMNAREDVLIGPWRGGTGGKGEVSDK